MSMKDSLQKHLFHMTQVFTFLLQTGKTRQNETLVGDCFSRVSILNSQNKFGFEIFTDFSWNQWELSQRLPRNKAMSTFHMIQEMNLRYHSLKMNDFYFYLLKRKVCLIRHATSPSAPEFKIKLRNFCAFFEFPSFHDFEKDSNSVTQMNLSVRKQDI